LGVIRPFILVFAIDVLVGGLLFVWPLFLTSALMGSTFGKVLFWLSILIGAYYLLTALTKQLRTMLIVTTDRLIYVEQVNLIQAETVETSLTDISDIQLGKRHLSANSLLINGDSSICTAPMWNALHVKHFIEDAATLARSNVIISETHGK
jgi:hypothetical protein